MSAAFKAVSAPRTDGVHGSRAVGRNEFPLAVGLGAALLVLQGLTLYLQLTGRHPLDVAALLTASAVWLGLSFAVLAGRLAISMPVLLVVALLLRLVVLFADPHFSTDIYRYIWDGRVQAAGINPYRHVPADEALVALRDASIFPRINRADYATTIYPPAAQAFFWAVTRIGETVVVMKSAMVAMEALALWGMLRLLRARGLPSERAVILAWSPLAVVEIAGSGHVDALMMAFAVLAILACAANARILAGSLLGLAVATKFAPLALVPALWRRWDWRLPLALGTVMVLAYLPYLGVGQAVLGFLPGYLGEEGIANGSGFPLLRAVRDLTGVAIPTSAYLAAVGACLGGLALWVQSWPDDERLAEGPVALAGAAVLALTPVYPWYLVWLLPLVAIARRGGIGLVLLWLVAVSPVLYVGDPRQQHRQVDLVYGSALCLAVLLLVTRRSRRARKVTP